MRGLRALLVGARAWVGWAPGSVHCGGRRFAPTALWCSRLTSGTQTRPCGLRQASPARRAAHQSAAALLGAPEALPRCPPHPGRTHCAPSPMHTRGGTGGLSGPPPAHEGRGGAWWGDLGASRRAGRARLPLALARGGEDCLSPYRGRVPQPLARPSTAEQSWPLARTATIGAPPSATSPRPPHPKGTPQKQKPRLHKEPRFSKTEARPAAKATKQSSRHQR